MADTQRKQRASGGADDEETRTRVLVGDDDPGVRDVLERLLSDEGFAVDQASTGQEALDALTRPEPERPRVALLDIKMPEMDGLEILQRMLEQGVDVPVILITGMNAGSITIKAMQMGAADYLQKPLDLDEVLIAVKKAIYYDELKRGAGSQLVPTTKTDPAERIIGSSPEMLRIFKTIGRVARTPATVLVTGETGTGKELMAEAIHNASDRRTGPLIKVNCAALPETLLESELFGHEKGSFTGALTQHKGRFEAAHKGTIFLDEVGEMTFGTQKKLLRVLQEREFERVGGNIPVKVDVRVIAATNRNLREEVVANRFREDLYYRLNVIAIHMPPLRERMEDIPALVSHFLNKHRYTPASSPTRITEEAMNKLMLHDWPGNVRELENIIQRAVVLCRGTIITPEHIQFQNELNRFILDVEQKVRANATLDDMLHDVKREAILTALRINDQDFAKAAAQLGLSDDQMREYLMELKLLGEMDALPSHEFAGKASGARDSGTA
ncbi:MAG TPA: sigma-54 dependent transcriptional regulator [Ktedonobacterales bacterium]|nr:sigma-54 dependent transcriptional regulator [Ktedonobacterales bacterium]